MNESKKWEQYIPQNTGWSGGVSWFDTAPGVHMNFKQAVALNAQQKRRNKDPAMLWRVIKRTTIEEVVD